MRALTAGLMEAGADLTDGLTVRTVPGGVHIAPCADRAALSGGIAVYSREELYARLEDFGS